MRKFILFLTTVFLTVGLAACVTPAVPAPEAEPVTPEAMSENTMSEDTASESHSGSAEPSEAVAYTVDTAASTIEWLGSKAIGDSHIGTVDIAEGQLSIVGDQLQAGSFVIDMTTIHTDDSDRLLGHLKSDDFFGVETHPTALLVLKSAEPTDTEGQYEVIADLTMKGLTEEIAFMADVTMENGMIIADADMIIDRSLFDVRYGSGSFFDNLGDDLINDEIELTVNLVANVPANAE